MRRILKKITFTMPSILILLSFYLLKYPLYIYLVFMLSTYIFSISNRISRIENFKWRKLILMFSGQYIMIFLYLIMIYICLFPIFFFVVKFREIFKEYHWLVILGFFIYYTYSFINFKRISVKKYIVDTFDLKKECKIVFVSDIHLDDFKSTKYLRKRIDVINSLDPAYVLIGGDIFDSYESLVKFDYIEEFDRLKAPVYAIWGNHDYYGNIDENRKKLSRSKIKILEDEGISIDNSFYILGRKDIKSKERKSLENLIKSVELPILLLDHQPVNIEKVAKNKNIKLQLSGHTHGGQIFPVTILYSIMYILNKGRKKVEETIFIVTQGIGAGFSPFRLGTKNEVLFIEIK